MLWRILSGQSGGENLEKREFAQKPVFSLKEIETYPAAYEAYYNDHLPFRDVLIKMYNSMMVHVFHTSSSDDVILGKDGWAFYGSRTDGTSRQCYDGSMLFTDEELEDIAANLMDAKERLSAQGIEFVVFVAPSKERVYSEYMPDYMGEPAPNGMMNQVISYLRGHTDVRVISPLKEMLAYKQEHPQQFLFYQTDTHWNDLGAYVGTSVLLKEFGIETPSLEQLETVVLPKARYDLTNILNVSHMDDHGALTVVYDEPVQKLKTLAYEHNGKVEYEMQDVPKKRFFMLKDSFGSGMVPYLKYHFSHSLMLHNTDYDPEQMWAYDPDIFVLEVTERYIRRLRNSIL